MRRFLLATLAIILFVVLTAGCAVAPSVQLEDDSFGFTASEFKQQFNELSDDDIGNWESDISFLDEKQRDYWWDFGNGVIIMVGAYKDSDAVTCVLTNCKANKMLEFMNYFPTTVAICDEPAITGKGEYTIDDVVEELGLFDESSYEDTNATIDKGKISYRFMADENDFSANIFITETQNDD